MTGFDLYEFREHIVKPALMAINMMSSSAVNLLLGTAAQESAMGHFLLQKKIGFLGGIGAYQMEKPTYDYMWDKQVANDAVLKFRIKTHLGYDNKPHAYRMASDLALATIAARLYYATFAERLPDANDVEGLAYYWKRYWNTEKGKGTIAQFIDNYKRYVQKDI